MDGFQRETLKRLGMALAFFVLCLLGELVSRSQAPAIHYLGLSVCALGIAGYLYALFSKAFAWRLTRLALGLENESHGLKS
jgi:hypothetical protein